MTHDEVKFKPGESGNPGGRPKSQFKQFQEILQGRDRVMINQIIGMAMNGDKDMLKFVGERILPAPSKSNPVDIDLANKTYLERAEEVIQAVTDKRISPSEAHTIMSALSSHLQIFESTEIIRRIQALEEGMKK